MARKAFPFIRSPQASFGRLILFTKVYLRQEMLLVYAGLVSRQINAIRSGPQDVFPWCHSSISKSALIRILFIAWALLLLVRMEALRSYIVVTGRPCSNELRPDNSNISPFMQRLVRTQANCVEGLPPFSALLAVALATGQSHRQRGVGRAGMDADLSVAQALDLECAHVAGKRPARPTIFDPCLEPKMFLPPQTARAQRL
jgi:uncharacterized MAPEG superfamily protein